MAKRFSLAEAQSLIPRLEPLLRDAITLKTEYGEAEAALHRYQEHVMLMGGVLLDRAQTMEARKRRESAAARLRAAIEQVQETGCVLKDLDVGLIDFPTLFRGEEVYLCWKLGETGIGYWHGTDEGFRGRKPIDQDFRDHHRGDPPQ